MLKIERLTSIPWRALVPLHLTSLIAGMTLMGLVGRFGAPSRLQTKYVNFQWLTVFDHSALKHAKTYRKLRHWQSAWQNQAQLENARTDVKFLPLVWESRHLKEIEGIIASGQREYEALSHRKAAEHLSTAINCTKLDGIYGSLPMWLMRIFSLLKPEVNKVKTQKRKIAPYSHSLNPNLQIKEFEHPKLVRLFKSARRSFLMRPRSYRDIPNSETRRRNNPHSRTRN